MGLLPDLAPGPVAFDEAVTPWRAWSPRAAAERLRAAAPSARWAVAGGWAIDLYLGRVTREHDDLEVSVLADDVPAVLAAFSGPDWQWAVPSGGRLHPPGRSVDTHQNWLWSPVEHAFVLDVFRESHEADTWVCRRDPAVRRLWREVVLTSADGVPHLSPEVVLLFKAKYGREKDEADLRSVLPSLPQDRRAWLLDALARVHPGHPWLERIGSARVLTRGGSTGGSRRRG